MGCGMSRYGMADNLVRRKLDNLRKGDPLVATIDDTPSTKLLLKNAQDHTVSNGDNSRKSISASPHELEAPKGASLEHKESFRVAKGDGAKKKEGGEEKEIGGKARNEEEVVDEKDKNGGEDSDYDDEGRVSDYDASALWIDSPSFREYCTHDSDSDDSFKDGGSSDGEKKEIKIEGDKCNSSPNLTEGAVTKPTRKGSKGRRSFRKVFPTGKPSAMKNLLNVASCYNPNAASAARDRKVGK